MVRTLISLHMISVTNWIQCLIRELRHQTMRFPGKGRRGGKNVCSFSDFSVCLLERVIYTYYALTASKVREGVARWKDYQPISFSLLVDWQVFNLVQKYCMYPPVTWLIPGHVIVLCYSINLWLQLLLVRFILGKENQGKFVTLLHSWLFLLQHGP